MGLCLTLATITRPNSDIHLQSDMTARAQSALMATQLGDVLLWCYPRESPPLLASGDPLSHITP